MTRPPAAAYVAAIALATALALSVGVARAAATSMRAGARHGATSTSTGNPAAAPVPPGFVGVVADQPTWPNPSVNIAQQLSVMVASGVESVRVVFDWADAQPYQTWADVPAGQGSQFIDVGGVPTDFAPLDQIVGLAAARGITVLPVILDAPSWDGETLPGGTVAIPKTPGPYAAFAKALVQRYGPQGTFWSQDPYGGKVPITMWQIWNEPNIVAFWPQQPYYDGYIALLRAAHAAIKSADPTAKIVLAGLPNYSWVELARLYKFPGARNLFDIVAVHPYTKTPRGVITILTYVREVMDEHGDARKPILADEISWPSSVGHTIHDTGYDFATTEAGQARNLGKLLPMLEADRTRLGVGGFYYYDWAGLERDNALAFDFSGLFRLSNGAFIAKPAYAIFRSDALAMEGCRSKGPSATDCAR